MIPEVDRHHGQPLVFTQDDVEAVWKGVLFERNPRDVCPGRALLRDGRRRNRGHGQSKPKKPSMQSHHAVILTGDPGAHDKLPPLRPCGDYHDEAAHAVDVEGDGRSGSRRRRCGSRSGAGHQRAAGGRRLAALVEPR